MTEEIRTAFIGYEPSELKVIHELLAPGTRRRPLEPRVELVTVDGISAGVTRVSRGDVDVILLDSTSARVHPADAMAALKKRGVHTPVVALTLGKGDELGVRAVEAGAQDYVVLEELSSPLLRRALRHAVECHHLQTALERSMLTDPVTGLLNRRGFFTHADHMMKLADRTKGLWLLFFDVQNMRGFNERFGQKEGDRLLVDVAAALRETYRESDLIARLNGDEFTVLLMDATRDAAEIVSSRLQTNLAALNSSRPHDGRVELAVGTARREPRSAVTLDQLLARADDALYATRKRSAAGN